MSISKPIRLKQNRSPQAAIEGAARLDKRTKNLAKRLSPGDIAIIDHVDLDQVSAESLLEKKVGAVVNAAKFNSGRYPNTGPLLLAAAGIRLIDEVGPGVFDRLREGDAIAVDGGNISKGGRLVARGRPLGAEEIRGAMDDARA